MMRNNVFSRKRMINRNQQRTGAVSEVDKSSNGRLMSSSKKVGGDNDSMKSYCFALMTQKKKPIFSRKKDSSLSGRADQDRGAKTVMGQDLRKAFQYRPEPSSVTKYKNVKYSDHHLDFNGPKIEHSSRGIEVQLRQDMFSPVSSGQPSPMLAFA